VRISLLALCFAACTGFHDAPPDDAGADGPPPNGSSFTVVQAQPVGETLTAVWGSDADNLFAVGTNGLHDDYYSGAWHRTQASLGRDLHGVWGTAVDDVYAVGEVTGTGQGIVLHFDGSGWRDEYLAATALHGIWGTGDAIIAVGAKGTIYGKLRGGTTWASRLGKGLPANPNVAASPDEPILHAIGGTSINDYAMPADADRIFQYQGNGDYINLDPAVDRSVVFWSLWADPATPGSVFFGTNYFGVTWLTTSAAPPTATGLGNDMYRLTQDQSQPGSDQLFIRGVWGLGTTVFFVGDQGHMYRYDAAPNDIAPVSSPTDAALWGAWGATLDDVWVVGERELILHGSLAQ
jgi:photosystem II stability/assembly factor-like uncharacterized protein